MNRRRSRLLCAVCLLLAAPALCAQSLQVIDADGHAKTFTAAEIAALPHVSVQVSDHGTSAQFEGVPLHVVLPAAGIKLEQEMRGPRMAEVLVVEATDNYKVVFALAELDPAFATREIILADKRDGKPLDAREGPFRVVAPGDKRPARWIRNATSMRIVAVK